MIAPLADYMRRYREVTIEWILHHHHPNFVADGIDCAVQIGAAEGPKYSGNSLAEVPRIVAASPALCAMLRQPGHR